MKILLIHNRYSRAAPGGEDVVVDAEQRLLESAGHQVVRYERSVDEVGAANPLDLLATAWEMQGSQRTHRELGALIERERPNLAHVHNLFPLISPSAYEACHQAGLPLVQTVHNYRLSCAAATHYRAGDVCESCDGTKIWPAVRHGCFRRSHLATLPVALMQRRMHGRRILQHGVSRFLTLTEFARHRLLSLGIAAHRIAVRANFIDLPAAAIPRDGQRLSSSPYAIFSGRLSEEKGVLTLLEAWRGVAGLALKVLGDGRLRQRCQRFATEHNLPVEFLGNLPRVEALKVVAGASMQIVPSRWFEGMPLVILEAWALGVPVIAARLGGMAEMIGHDERGLAFTAGDAQHLLQRITQLRDSPGLAEELRLAGRRRYAALHTPERGLESLLEQYRQVLGGDLTDQRPLTDQLP